MAKINLDLDPKSLKIESFQEDDKTKYRVTLAISEDENNTITIEDDGLYSEGDPATVGMKLDVPQIHGGIRVGYFSQWNTNREKHNETRVSCNGIVHRTWTADDEHGTNLRGKNDDDVFRGVTGAPEGEENLDVILPGDFLRVPKGNNTFDYYIITQVNQNDRIQSVALLITRGGGH
jgi:hypothetical protein